MRSLATQSALGNCGNFHSVPFSTATTVVSMLEKAAWDKKFSCLVDLCQQPVSSIFAASYLGFVLRLFVMAVIFLSFCDGSYFFRLLAMAVIFLVGQGSGLNISGISFSISLSVQRTLNLQQL